MSTKKSFIVHLDSLSVLDDLNDAQAGQLLRAMLACHNGEDLVLEPIVKVAFNPFKNQFIRDGKKYQETVEKNQKNGKKGGRPKKNPNEASDKKTNPEKPKKPSGFSENPSKPKKADSGSGSGSGSGNDSEKKSTGYSPLFERLWAGIVFPEGLGNKGNKSEAFNEFKKLKADDALVSEIIAKLSKQAEHKVQQRQHQGFAPSFKHVYRMIKHRAWEEETEPCNTQHIQRSPSDRVMSADGGVGL